MIEIFAPAKINLYLHVVGRRADGYHLLDSLVTFVDGVGDRLRIIPAEAFSLHIEGEAAGALAATAVNDNLVTRAAHALAKATGKRLNCKIILDKDMPIASGIGGGSSDAAACLLGLCQFWQIDADMEILMPIARSLGQDVVACLTQQTCYFRGIGDEIAESPSLPKAAILMVNPRQPVPTPAVFAARSGAFSQAAEFASRPTDLAALIKSLESCRNDLTAPALTIAPVIKQCLQALQNSEACLYTTMSGSGATCFGLFADSAQAAAAGTKLRQHHPDWWIRQGTIPFIAEAAE
jgi:4-diphosphocytidyl-2-C-methyl-D-erythritol kinase